jgi:hypothetical protein
MSLLRNYETKYSGPQVQDLVSLDIRARMALDIAKHCSMMTAAEDGEDSTGRQKIRLLTPSEIATRAVDIASLMYDRFCELDWLADNPLLGEDETDEDESSK